MKYLVSKKAILSFADGTQIELQPGISSFPDEVINHWAFSAHAQPIDENELKQKDLNDSSAFLEEVIEKLVTENEDLKSQIAVKDVTISEMHKVLEEMKAQVDVKSDKTLTENNTEKKPGAGNGKKQSSADS
ncbi:STY1053 family phage-associated protein [Photorhabdus sp. SF281]|uniref:STY1053 family phage-associated protein n=1 Tax=Photorhabdus sp. SF281 TaxID=3459527 RepID=UPI0040444377